jgi:hypothetical protein
MVANCKSPRIDRRAAVTTPMMTNESKNDIPCRPLARNLQIRCTASFYCFLKKYGRGIPTRIGWRCDFES